jgi:hypothetical protein
MSKNFLLTLSGTTPGPFDIYLDSVSAGNLLLSNVDSGSLLGGYIITTPDSSSFVILKNKANGCDNTFTVSIVDPSPTPTPTTTPTTTPSITPTVTPSVTITPTITPSVTITPTITPSVTITPTKTPSVTITPTKTPTRTITPTPTPSPMKVPTSFLIRDAFQSNAFGICYSNGNATQYIDPYRSTQITLLDQYGDEIASPQNLSILIVYDLGYEGGGTNTSIIVFNINAGSSQSGVYNYPAKLTDPGNCLSQTRTFNRYQNAYPVNYTPIYNIS